MKLLRHEGFLFLIALFFLLIASFCTFSPEEGTVAETPEGNAVPYFININTADVNELSLLDGIGPKLAERIVEYRNKNGKFSSVAELLKVSGIGQAVIAEISEYATT